MLAESTAKTLYSVMEPGTWAERQQGDAARFLCLSAHGGGGVTSGSERESSATFSPTAQALVSMEAHVWSLVQRNG